MTSRSETGAEGISAPELLNKACDLLPVLRERAAQTEELRRIPDESVEDLFASGLCRIGVPKRFGGLDVSYGLAIDVAAELGRGCPSTSWCYGLWAAHAWLVGFWPLQAQEEVYGDGPDVLCSSSLNPGKSTCEAVEGGYRLSGRWEFSSGCDAASWIMVGAPNIGERTWVLVPREDFEIVDTWFVSGLRGSGSKDIAIHDAFVPNHRILEVTTAGVSDLSAYELHGQAQYRVPVSTLLGWDLVGPMVGIAQGMIDEFTSRLEGTSGPGRTADSPAIHVRLSQASAEVDAARGMMEQDVWEILRKGEAGESFSLLGRARFRRDKAFISQLCLQAVNRLFDLSGGHGLFDSVPLQRFHRDAHAVAHRDGLIMEMGGQDYARVLFGLPPSGQI
ncbi:Flavin-dependent monooxygenase, oxygenase subunit HsaA [Geodia barretti]|uniref:Flavin-dependent monooxygenase, oxygenase subunit HsaA n=1 Tax=Geodia barretti TaxID=519541 RepID=A0AA35QY10_GEOBA|nr:Flavin-dependent monooxygenase, oxygenase subunit HsaA [Geodia barretti]